MSAFKIIIPDDLRKYPDYTLSEVATTTNLDRAIILLGDMYWTRAWYMEVGGQQFTWWFEDIGYIWEDIPAFLQSVNTLLTEFPMFSTVSQGTEKIVQIEADNDSDVLIAIISADNTERFWDYFNGQLNPEADKFPRVRVSRAEYIAEWKQFINTIVDMLVKESLIEWDDASLQAYLKNLP